jgi:hypothetical protein
MRRRRRQKGADFLETDREKKRINNKGVMRDALEVVERLRISGRGDAGFVFIHLSPSIWPRKAGTST